MTGKNIVKNESGHLGANRKGHQVIGILMLLIGIFWLAKKAGWIPVAAGGASIFWPVILIAAGTFMLIVKNHHKNKEV